MFCKIRKDKAYMKRLNSFKTVMILCIAVMLLMSVTVSAATSREMMENGAVSDGSVVYGDKRDGVVSDVSGSTRDAGDVVSDIGSDIGNAGDRVEDFVETALPNGTDRAETTAHDTTDRADTTTHMTTNRAETSAHETTNTESDMTATKGGAVWGIIIAVTVVIAVVAIIFYLTKRH